MKVITKCIWFKKYTAHDSQKTQSRKTMDCDFQHWHTGSDKTPQESINTTFYSHFTQNTHVLKVTKTTQ